MKYCTVNKVAETPPSTLLVTMDEFATTSAVTYCDCYYLVILYFIDLETPTNGLENPLRISKYLYKGFYSDCY